MVPVQTGSETVSGKMGMPRLEMVFGKIPDWDQDHGVWSGPDRVPIGPGPNFPNTSVEGIGCTYFCRFTPVCPHTSRGRTGWPVGGPRASAQARSTYAGGTCG